MRAVVSPRPLPVAGRSSWLLRAGRSPWSSLVVVWSRLTEGHGALCRRIPCSRPRDANWRDALALRQRAPCLPWVDWLVRWSGPDLAEGLPAFVPLICPRVEGVVALACGVGGGRGEARLMAIPSCLPLFFFFMCSSFFLVVVCLPCGSCCSCCSCCYLWCCFLCFAVRPLLSDDLVFFFASCCSFLSTSIPGPPCALFFFPVVIPVFIPVVVDDTRLSYSCYWFYSCHSSCSGSLVPGLYPWLSIGIYFRSLVSSISLLPVLYSLPPIIKAYSPN